MQGILDTLYSGLPILLGHFSIAILMLSLGIVLYLVITPVNEYRLIQQGNKAAALTLGSAMLGITLPLAAALGSSINFWDIVIWGSVAIILQLLVFFLLDLILRGLAERIKNEEMSAALILGSTKLSVALLNAAAIGY
jgi:putative membrane protein